MSHGLLLLFLEPYQTFFTVVRALSKPSEKNLLVIASSRVGAHSNCALWVGQRGTSHTYSKPKELFLRVSELLLVPRCHVCSPG
jgi:hypothetical protein